MMSDDPRADLVPVKDVSGSGYSLDDVRVSQISLDESTCSRERLQVVKMSREELEDRYFRLLEDHSIIKKHGRKQEEKIKKLAGKLVRLLNDQRKDRQQHNAPSNPEHEIAFEDMQQRICEYERENRLLHDRVGVLQQQLVAKQEMNTPGRPRTASSTSSLNRSSLSLPMGPKTSQTRFKGGASQNVMRLLQEARKENAALLQKLETLQEQDNHLREELDQANEESRLREMEQEEELMSLREQLSQTHEHELQDELGVIHMRRDLQEAEAKTEALAAECRQADEVLKQERTAAEMIRKELDKVKEQLQQEKSNYLELQGEVRESILAKQTVKEYQQQLSDLQLDNELLQKTNEKLVGAALNSEKEKQHLDTIDSLKLQIAQLEATVKSDLQEQSTLLGRLEEERQRCRALELQLREQEKHMAQLRESNVTLTNEEQRKDFDIQEPKFLRVEPPEVIQSPKVPDEEVASVSAMIRKPLFVRETPENIGNLERSEEVALLRAQFLETAEELEKTRHLLGIQHRINQDYKTQVSLLTQHLSEVQVDHAARLREYTRLLNLRANRIHSLETSNGTLEPSDVLASSLSVGPGQGLFELQIRMATLTSEGLSVVGHPSPRVFATWSFMGRDLQYTAVVSGPKANFHLCSVYPVDLDAHWNDFLRRGGTRVELHLAVGEDDSRIIARGELQFSELLTFPSNRLHGMVTLHGLSDDNRDLATLEYSFRMQASQIWWQVEHGQKAIDASDTLLSSLPMVTSPTITLLPGEKEQLSNGEAKASERQARPKLPAPAPRVLPRKRGQTVVPNQKPSKEAERKELPVEGTAHYEGDNTQGVAVSPKAKVPKASPRVAVPQSHETTPEELEKSEKSTDMPSTLQTLSIVEEVSESTQEEESQDPEEQDKQRENVSEEAVDTDYEDDTMFDEDDDEHQEESEPLEGEAAEAEQEVGEEEEGVEEGDETEERKTVKEKEEEKESVVEPKKKETVIAEVHQQPSLDSSSVTSSGDSEGVVVANIPSGEATSKKDVDSNIEIGVGILTLSKKCKAMKKGPSVIAGVFVEFPFLDVPPEETETPFALPLPKKAEQPMNFKYKTVISMDPKVHAKRRKMLGNMLSPDSGKPCLVRFTVVSEPPEDKENLDNQDIGFSDVDLHQMLRNGHDLEDKKVPVKDLDKGRNIGTLRITVKGINVLKSVQQESMSHS